MWFRPPSSYFTIGEVVRVGVGLQQLACFADKSHHPSLCHKHFRRWGAWVGNFRTWRWINTFAMMGLYTVEMRFGGDMDVETDGQGITGRWKID